MLNDFIPDRDLHKSGNNKPKRWHGYFSFPERCWGRIPTVTLQIYYSCDGSPHLTLCMTVSFNSALSTQIRSV